MPNNGMDWKSVKTLQVIDRVSKLTFSADGRWLIAASKGRATVFETKGWEARKEISPPEQWSYKVPLVRFSPNGKRLVAAFGGFVKLLEVGSWGEIHTLHQDNTVSEVAFSPDGQRLAAWVEGENGRGHERKPSEIHIWSTSDWTPAACRDDAEPTPLRGRVICAEVKGVGREVALSEVYQWKEATRLDPLKVTQELKPGSYISPDGLWSLESGSGAPLSFNEGKNERPIITLMPGTSLDSWTFSPDSRWLVIAARNTVALWPLESTKMIDAACARLRRHSLTLKEWEPYNSDRKLQPTCSPSGPADARR